VTDTKVLNQASGEGWTIWNGDSVEVIAALPDNSVDFTVFSPPFSSLYTYSNSSRDMGNVKDDAEFAEHFGHLTPSLFAKTKPGRLLAAHCMLLPTSKARDGFIGLKDFRGLLIRAFQDAGFIFHSEVTIWKNPVTAMQRTKALGLLHKQIRKDSCMSRQGINDYLVVMRKPGENPDPVAHGDGAAAGDFPVERWQRYASGVWATERGVDDEGMVMFEDPNKSNPNKDGIAPGDTLQYMSARENDDERHICPLQLEVIRRAVRLWTNPGDIVLSPYVGIGSEGYISVQEGRRFVGGELKRSYFDLAVRNIKSADPKQSQQVTMFGSMS
jgi:hypothetical protein